MCVVVGAGHNTDLIVSLVGLGGSSLAIHSLQILIGVLVGVGVTHAFIHLLVCSNVVLQILNQGVQSGLLFFGQLMAVGNCHIIQGIGALDIVACHADECVSPGGAGGLVVNLLVQSLGSIQTEVNGIAAVAVVPLVDSIDIEIVQLNSGQGVIADVNSLGISGQHGNNGGGKHGGQNDAQAQSQNNPEGGGVSLDLLLFLGFLALPLGHLSHILLFAELFLVGCTHGIISSQIVGHAKSGFSRIDRDIITDLPAGFKS